MLRIDSEANPRFRFAKSLLTRKGRSKQGYFIAEGLRNIQLAMQYRHSLEMVLLREDMADHPVMDEIRKIGVEKTVLLGRKLFEQLTDTVHSQGILGICPIPNPVFEVGKLGELVLILDRISDPGNAGTLIRTADSAGIADIFYTKGCTDFYSPKVVRAAMGSLFYINLYELKDMHSLKEAGYRILAADVRTSRSYEQMSGVRKRVLILGNEANGISEQLLIQADERISIPLYGKAESLNVAVAGGILMYKMKEKARR